MPYGSLRHDDLAGDEVADAEGLSWVVSVDVEHDELGPAWVPTCARVLFVLAVTVDRAAVSGVCGPFISARRGALISRKPVSGRRERKTSVLRPKRGRMVAATG